MGQLTLFLFSLENLTRICALFGEKIFSTHWRRKKIFIRIRNSPGSLLVFFQCFFFSENPQTTNVSAGGGGKVFTAALFLLKVFFRALFMFNHKNDPMHSHTTEWSIYLCTQPLKWIKEQRTTSIQQRRNLGIFRLNRDLHCTALSEAVLFPQFNLSKCLHCQCLNALSPLNSITRIPSLSSLFVNSSKPRLLSTAWVHWQCNLNFIWHFHMKYSVSGKATFSFFPCFYSSTHKLIFLDGH